MSKANREASGGATCLPSHTVQSTEVALGRAPGGPRSKGRRVPLKRLPAGGVSEHPSCCS